MAINERCAQCPVKCGCRVDMVKINGGWEVRCAAGIPGGGDPATLSEIEAQDQRAGRISGQKAIGSNRRQDGHPTEYRDEFGIIRSVRSVD